jgi:hypothetical protein
MIACGGTTKAGSPRPAMHGYSLARNLVRACVHPRRAWNKLRRWSLLARYAELPHAEITRYRRELRNDAEFQAHLTRFMGDVGYVTCGPELYTVVRAMKPGVIVETGVASGVSSAHILRALEANDQGVLFSIDLPNVQEGSILPEGRTPGWIVPEGLRGRWQLQLGDSRELLPALLGTLDRVDLFMHDSDHAYESMCFELAQAIPRVVGGGLLMSDDTHLHSAWDEACAQHGLRSTRVGRLGVTRKRRRL